MQTDTSKNNLRSAELTTDNARLTTLAAIYMTEATKQMRTCFGIMSHTAAAKTLKALTTSNQSRCSKLSHYLHHSIVI